MSDAVLLLLMRESRDLAALDVDAAPGPGGGEEELRKHATLLLMEALARERRMKSYDVFHRRVRPVDIDRVRRRWTARGGPGAASGRYGGPAAVGGSGDSGILFLVIRMPELLEGKPPIAMLDRVHLRPSSRAAELEVAGAVLALDGEFAIFGISSDAGDALSACRGPADGDDDGGFFVHVRFVASESALKHMSEAMARAMRNVACARVPRAPGAVRREQGHRGAARIDTEALAQLEGLLGVNREQAYVADRFASGFHASGTGAPAGAGAGPPFVVVGPPGTGKTRTVVASIEHLLRAGRNARGEAPKVLACAPTDFAADIIAEGLVRRLRGDGGTAFRVLRVCDPRRFAATVKSVEVLDLCLIDQTTQLFRLPTPLEVSRADVVVASCISSGSLPSASSWSHIIVDEAGQALVPEVLVPLSRATGDTHVVLVGDPQQLGPSVESRVAAQGGLGLSLLERLVLKYRAEGILSPEAPGAGGVYLVRNYRSSARLLRLSSSLFYDERLVAVRDGDEVTRLPPLDGWLGEEMMRPRDRAAAMAAGDTFFFCGVRGQARRDPEAMEPTYYNAEEAMTCVDLIESMLRSSGGRLTSDSIGVMASYRLQVRKIRALLRARGLGGVRVGTVDDYQGQEERVIFLSTVVTNARVIMREKGGKYKGDVETSLGSMLSNAKRFNVAITRARACCVVVGHPGALACDSNWRRLIRYCAEQGTCMGEAAEVDEATGTDDRPPAAAEELGRIAELSLLGPGDDDLIFPDDLDDIYDTVSRVML